MLKLLLHVFFFTFLTILTQVGGLLYLISIFVFFKVKSHRKLKVFLFFLASYTLSSLLIIPFVAPIFGREKIKETEWLHAHSYFYVLANRNYVKPELNTALQAISKDLASIYPGIHLVYLDANFPFINGFPLIPHLSHNDGKKIDLSFIYTLDNEHLTNKKPSLSGYGVFEGPLSSEFDQIASCQSQGYWQYNFAQYVRIAAIHPNLKFSNQANRAMINRILEDPQIEKLFIEPHLKLRLGLSNSKIRFHGCHAVRHDDHLHFQVY